LSVGAGYLPTPTLLHSKQAGPNVTAVPAPPPLIIAELRSPPRGSKRALKPRQISQQPDFLVGLIGPLTSVRIRRAARTQLAASFWLLAVAYRVAARTRAHPHESRARVTRYM
jgi:hypothetical protein